MPYAWNSSLTVNAPIIWALEAECVTAVDWILANHCPSNRTAVNNTQNGVTNACTYTTGNSERTSYNSGASYSSYWSAHELGRAS